MCKNIYNTYKNLLTTIGFAMLCYVLLYFVMKTYNNLWLFYAALCCAVLSYLWPLEDNRVDFANIPKENHDKNMEIMRPPLPPKGLYSKT